MRAREHFSAATAAIGRVLRPLQQPATTQLGLHPERQRLAPPPSRTKLTRVCERFSAPT
jgi:hypothetical protein